MKTEYITCDECGNKIENELEFRVDKYDICKVCRKQALLEFFRRFIPKTYRISNCKKCNGKGKIKDFYGYNNDFEWITCECSK